MNTYGYMTATNRNVTTGIPYGIIKASAIDPDLWQELCDVHGTDVHYETALAEHIERERNHHQCAIDAGEIDPDEGFDEDYVRQQFADSYHCDEPVYEGEHEGVMYRTTWLGGAPMLFVFKSPYVTKCSVCSPCVPGAGDLDSPGDYEAYGVPVTWLTEDFINEFVHDSGCGIFLHQGTYIHSPDRTLQQISKASFQTVEQANEDCYKMRLQRRLDDQ